MLPRNDENNNFCAGSKYPPLSSGFDSNPERERSEETDAGVNAGAHHAEITTGAAFEDCVAVGISGLPPNEAEPPQSEGLATVHGDAASHSSPQVSEQCPPSQDEETDEEEDARARYPTRHYADVERIWQAAGYPVGAGTHALIPGAWLQSPLLHQGGRLHLLAVKILADVVEKTLQMLDEAKLLYNNIDGINEYFASLTPDVLDEYRGELSPFSEARWEFVQELIGMDLGVPPVIDEWAERFQADALQVSEAVEFLQEHQLLEVTLLEQFMPLPPRVRIVPPTLAEITLGDSLSEELKQQLVSYLNKRYREEFRMLETWGVKLP